MNVMKVILKNVPLTDINTVSKTVPRRYVHDLQLLLSGHQHFSHC